jgi:hypothetical protein
LGEKELLIISVRCNEKGSLSKADRQLFKVIQTYWRIARRCFNKIGNAQKSARRTDLGFPWFALSPDYSN